MPKTTTVAPPDPPRDDYLLGRSVEEYERLRDQARMWEPETSALLDRVALGAGDRCLDAGCGPGETMRLMAERVGPKGSVTGVDLDAPLGAQALRMLNDAGHRQCWFEQMDVETEPAVPGAPFDLVFARLLLLHVDDPVAVLRRLWSWVAPGGHLVVQDYDLVTGGEVVPGLEVMDEFRAVTLDLFREAGRDIRIGSRLAALHLEAGLGAPDGVDAAVRLAPLSELAPKFEAVYRSLLPAALELGVTTRSRSEQWLEAFARESVAADGHTALWALLAAAWKRKGEAAPREV